MSEMNFVNEKTGKRYTVVKFDRDAGQITLKGEHGVEFTERYDKDLFQRLGYRLEASPPAAA